MTDVKIPGLEFTDLQRRLSRRCGTRRQTGVSRQTVVSPELALASLASFPRESDNQADLDSRSSVELQSGQPSAWAVCIDRCPSRRAKKWRSKQSNTTPASLFGRD
jgi:hypothetical protein